MTLGEIIGGILEREGGYVNRPEDRGGPTKYGITGQALADWRSKPVSTADIKGLSQEEARAIYVDRYVVRPGFSMLPDPLRGLVVDCAVNHGPITAVKWLQFAVGTTQDGKWGPISEAALSIADKARVYKQVIARRIRHYGKIISKDPTQAIFAAGWAERAAHFVERTP